jgi:hypothetical protein
MVTRSRVATCRQGRPGTGWVNQRCSGGERLCATRQIVVGEENARSGGGRIRVVGEEAKKRRKRTPDPERYHLINIEKILAIIG